jgi:hypothetical protein
MLKRLLILPVYILLVAATSLYLYRSGELFATGVKHLQEKQNIAAIFPFADLVAKYPESPYTAVARVFLVIKDPVHLTYMDLFFQTRKVKDPFERYVGKSPAFYDSFFFYACGYLLILTTIGVLQRYWAGAIGLSYASLIGRASFAALLIFTYLTWVRDGMEAGTIANKLAISALPALGQPLGYVLIIAAFSAFMLIINGGATVMTFFGFFGKRKIPISKEMGRV